MSRPGVCLALSILLGCASLAGVAILIFEVQVLTGTIIVDTVDPRAGRLTAYQPNAAWLVVQLALAVCGPVMAYRLWRRAKALYADPPGS